MKTKLTIFVTVLAAGLFAGGCTSTPKGPPLPHAVYWNGGWYAYLPDDVNWHAAKKKCEELGGQLACIETEAENNFVTGLMMFANPDVNFCWIGYSVKKNGERVWVNGKLLAQGYKNLKALKTEADRTGGVMQVRDYQSNPSPRHPYENLGKWWSAWDDFFTNPSTGHWEVTSRPNTGYIVEWE